MDLFTLPDEMLASIYQYCDFNSLSKIRKLSTKLNKVAKKYGFDKPRIKDLTITAEYDGAISVKLDTCCDLGHSLEVNHENQTIYTILELYLSKIRRLNSLQFINQVDQEDVAKLLLKQRLLRLSALSFDGCDIQFDMKLLRRILLAFPIKRLTLNLFVNDEETSPYKDELFDDIQLDELELRPLNIDSEITLHALRQLCSRKMPRLLEVALNVKIANLATFLDDHINASFHMNECCWSFTMLSGGLNKNEIMECLKKTKSLKMLGISEVAIDANELALEIAGFCIFPSVNFEQYLRGFRPEPLPKRLDGLDRHEPFLKLRVMF